VRFEEKYKIKAKDQPPNRWGMGLAPLEISVTAAYPFAFDTIKLYQNL
jgi:hypothetical protein